MADEKDPNAEVMKAFNEFKATNDANTKQRDVLLDEKLARIETTLQTFEPLNQKATLADKKAEALQEQMDRVETILNRPGKQGDGGPVDKDAMEYRGAFSRVIRKASLDWAPADTAVINKRKATLVRGDDAGAGYLLAPPDMLTEIIKDIIEISPMRSLATVRTIGGPSLKQPKRTGTASATRVGETQARVNTGDPAYGMVEIMAPELFARAEISQQMLEDSDYDLEAELRSEFSEQFGLKEGYEFINGVAASNQAEGLLTNAAVGEVVSGHATLITADGLIGLVYGLKTGYAARATMIFARSTIAAIRKLKDGAGNYLWAPGVAGIVPNTILGSPYVEMPDMPAISAGTYPVAYGDFKRVYTIADRIMMSFQSDFTTGADNGIVVYRARKRVGGGVRQADAMKKLKIAAS